MKSSEHGFTIIELLIATTIFSLMLVLTSTTIIGISQTYVKGSVEGQTQQSARAILSDISQDIQFNRATSISPPAAVPMTTDEYYFCIGSDIYLYQFDKYLDPGKPPPVYSGWGLVRYESSSCTPSASPPVGATELLATNERLGWLSLVPVTVSGGTTGYQVDVEVGYGSNTLLTDTTNPPPPAPAPNGNGDYVNGATSPPLGYQYFYQCVSGLDSSFCATSTLTTTVVPRIN